MNKSNVKIEIELFNDDFKYKGIEIWAYEEYGCFYRIESGECFTKLSQAIEFIDNKLKDIKND